MKIPQPTATKLNRNSFVTPSRRQESDQLRAEEHPSDAGNSYYYAHAGNFHQREAADDNHNANPYDVRHMDCMDCYNNIDNSSVNSLKNPESRPGKIGRMH